MLSRLVHLLGYGLGGLVVLALVLVVVAWLSTDHFAAFGGSPDAATSPRLATVPWRTLRQSRADVADGGGEVARGAEALGFRQGDAEPRSARCRWRPTRPRGWR